MVRDRIKSMLGDEVERNIAGGLDISLPVSLFIWSSIFLFLATTSLSLLVWIFAKMRWSDFPVGCLGLNVLAWLVFMGIPMFHTFRTLTFNVVAVMSRVVLAKARIAEELVNVVQASAEYEVMEAGSDDIRLIPVGNTRIAKQPAVLYPLPGGQRVDVKQLVAFLTAVTVGGASLGRDNWSPPLQREVYDAITEKLTQSGILVDKKPGFAGKMAITDLPEIASLLGITDYLVDNS